MRCFSSISPCLFAALLFVPLAALAASGEAYVKIKSPLAGAKLDAMDQTKLVYEVVPGPRGDHIHVYVDNKEVGILRRLPEATRLKPSLPVPATSVSRW